MPKSLLRTACLAVLVGLGSFAVADGERPNVIVIFTDDHGWPDLGVSGIYKDLRTPNLDRLAKDGVYATNGYASAPQCVPSRAGILTGKYQNRFGVESNGVSLTGFDAEKTIAERLKAAGYATGQIGKWHLGPAPKIVAHGFDDVYAKNSNRPCHANFTLDGQTIGSSSCQIMRGSASKKSSTPTATSRWSVPISRATSAAYRSSEYSVSA